MPEPLVTVIANVLLKARAVEQCGTEPSRLQLHHQEEALSHVAMDGKTLRGTLGHESEGQPEVASALPLRVPKWHRLDATSGPEHARMRSVRPLPRVHPALVKGRIISTDAMHTQKKWCACVHAYEGYYLTIVKKNQPQLYEDLVDFFDDPDAEQHEWQHAKSVQKGHGRLEIRELWESHADE